MIGFNCLMEIMRVKKIVDEDFNNYKDACMFICTASCNGKCCTEAGLPISLCQNNPWRSTENINVPDETIIQRYLKNGITSGICFGGLEPFEQFEELMRFIEMFRCKYHCSDTIIIYTGFNENEVSRQLEELKKFGNIIIKFGRFIPNQVPHYDTVLGVNLASDNQYAVVFR